ncbi:hypothetical protein ACHHYP_10976 [Achlya hypogyna]|uniref:Uncharacterized protein n=1 Tax=Achlya hypogyna TaxID=1202772 RepID=A0A1V9YK59_ACHHY|nr:hypothetical protein ACHHYP_10976 [Achlya hypogyna]
MATEDRGSPWTDRRDPSPWISGREYGAYTAEEEKTPPRRSSAQTRRSASPVYDDGDGTRRPSSSSVRRFQLHEPDERIERMQRQQDKLRFRQMLDEQMEEKNARKAKEEAARKREEAPIAAEELRYNQEQHVRAQQKLGHVATLRPPAPKFMPGARFQSAGGAIALPAPLPEAPTRTKLTIQTMPPPAPTQPSSPRRPAYMPPTEYQPSSPRRPAYMPPTEYQPPSPYRPSYASSARPQTPSPRPSHEHSREMLSQVQALLDEIRFERLQLRQEREVIALERQRLAEETARFLELQRTLPPPTPTNSFTQSPARPWAQFDAHTLSPTASQSPQWSPYRSTRDASKARSTTTPLVAPRRRFFDDHVATDTADDVQDNPLEQSLCCDSTFIPIDVPLETATKAPTKSLLAPAVSPLSSVDENEHNRRVIQTSGKYNWDVDDAVAPPRRQTAASSTDPAKLFQVKVLV